MGKKSDMIAILVNTGVIGAKLGALVANKKHGDTLSALAGAAIAATWLANEEAAKTNLPMTLEENGKLYKILPGGEKRFIRTINKSAKKIPQKFRLT